MENLKSRKNEKLKTEGGQPKSSTSWANLAKIKTDWITAKSKIELDMLKEQHEEFIKTKKLERELMIEKHNMEMELLKLEIEKRKN